MTEVIDGADYDADARDEESAESEMDAALQTDTPDAPVDDLASTAPVVPKPKALGKNAKEKAEGKGKEATKVSPTKLVAKRPAAAAAAGVHKKRRVAIVVKVEPDGVVAGDG